ncbi:MAG TPA: mersacidin/lichenicidin family type 2 lantibiotic [Symbiobacteriaceae bacterium]|nr:mersacidin/lichenicidin family type 2 lantibiotic [Symbiobacteriaceae bacterium]
MSRDLIVRAWKNPQFRATLSPEQRALVPAHPAGAELDEDELRGAVGGLAPIETAPTSVDYCTIAGGTGCLQSALYLC